VAKKIITVDNPLGPDQAVTFGENWWKCDNPCVRLTELGSMQGNKEGTFELEYRPLKTTEGGLEKVKLHFEIEELGQYIYDLELVAMPPTAQYQIRFECPLGEKQAETFTFKCFNHGATSFANSVGQPKFFTVEGSTKVEQQPSWDGHDVRVQVVFEPAEIGEIRDTLRLKSDAFGEYECTLIGICKPQLPRGPFEIASGGSLDVEFRNVFDSALDFSFVTDDPQFTVGASVVNIPARTSKAIQVKFTKADGSQNKVSAKLSVRCNDKPEVPPWIYYLSSK
jgi:hypothetical protein